MKRTVIWFAAFCGLVAVNSSALAQEKKAVKPGQGAGPAAWTGDLTPISPVDWNYARAAHLLERAGFGGTPEEIQRLARMAPEQAVNYLTDYQLFDNPWPKFEPSGIYKPGCDPSLAACPISDVIAQGYEKGEAMGIPVKKEKGKRWLQPLVQQAYYHVLADRGEMDRVEEWWAQRMVATRRPLEEKMTLFWHGHFATSGERVRDYRLMLQQQEMLRKHATGNLRALLLGIAQDPAMLVYLDNGLNVKGALKEKATAQYVTRSMYKFLVRTDLSRELETKLADNFRAGKDEIKPFLKMLFLSKDFYSPASYGKQVKRPVQLVISTYRKLGLTKVPGIPDFRTVTEELGQELFHPPSAASWEGGAAWINPATLLTRGNFARDLLTPDAAKYEVSDRPGFKRLLKKLEDDMKGSKVLKEKNKDKFPSSVLDTHEEFSLKDGVAWGLTKANATVKSIPRTPAELDLRGMLKQARATTADEAVDYFIKRFLRVPLGDAGRKELVAFLTKQHGARLNFDDPRLEPALRGLVHRIMSLREYQLG